MQKSKRYNLANKPLHWFNHRSKGKWTRKKCLAMIITSLIYTLCRERNSRLFGAKPRELALLSQEVMRMITSLNYIQN